jgi:hypothetical protein
MKMKLEKRLLCRNLRNQGYTISKINQITGFSKGSISNWCSDIDVNNGNNGKILRKKYKEKRIRYQNQCIKKMTETDYIAGCMLYWAEGKKSKNKICFVNSDIHMIKLFISFLIKYFNINIEKLTISINCHTTNGISLEEIENYWITNLGLKRNNIRKGTTNNYPISSKRLKINKLPYGTCSLSYNDVKVVQEIYGAIQKYGNFINDEWS